MDVSAVESGHFCCSIDGSEDCCHNASNALGISLGYPIDTAATPPSFSNDIGIIPSSSVSNIATPTTQSLTSTSTSSMSTPQSSGPVASTSPGTPGLSHTDKMKIGLGAGLGGLLFLIAIVIAGYITYVRCKNRRDRRVRDCNIQECGHDLSNLLEHDLSVGTSTVGSSTVGSSTVGNSTVGTSTVGSTVGTAATSIVDISTISKRWLHSVLAAQHSGQLPKKSMAI